METKQDISYGVVPLIKRDDGWYVLLIHQTSFRGDSFWALPKGHGEAGETAIESALRELREETGVEKVTLERRKTFLTGYFFEDKGVRTNKVVQYWIGYCDNEDTLITQPEEISALEWCDFKTALERLSHKNAKEVLTEVEHYLELDE